jgi:hypothetical protein
VRVISALRTLAVGGLAVILALLLPLAALAKPGSVGRALDSAKNADPERPRQSERPGPPPGKNQQRFARLLGRAARKVRDHLRPNCLTLALASSWLLRLSRTPHTLLFGVRSAPEFASHAWLRVTPVCIPLGEEHNGMTVIWTREWP